MVVYGFCLTDQELYFINRMDSDCVRSEERRVGKEC